MNIELCSIMLPIYTIRHPPVFRLLYSRASIGLSVNVMNRIQRFRNANFSCLGLFALPINAYKNVFEMITMIKSYLNVNIAPYTSKNNWQLKSHVRINHTHPYEKQQCGY